MISFNFPRIAPLLATAICLASSTASANPTQRIVGGAPILIESAPSIVAIIGRAELASTGSVALSQFCGGTLIDPSWVMTAAHCVAFEDDILSPDEIQIVANSHDLNNIASDPIDVAQIIIHEEFSYFEAFNDIALLQLSSPVVDGSQVAALNSTPVAMDERVVAAGWGARQFTEADGPFDFADNLHAVELLALPAEQCNTLPAYAGFITESMLCAGFPQGGASSCLGDSGGPLYRQNADGSMVVAGITSWGDGCALEQRPAVYTDVASFNDWLRTNMDVPVEPPVMPETVTVDPVDPVDPNGGLSVTTNPDDGSTVIVVPSLESLQAAGGSASRWLSLILLGFVGFRARQVAR